MPFAGIKSRLNGHDLEQVRAEFVQLYIDEDKDLKDVAEIFRARGLCASEQQWKTQIALWKIHKNNRERHMVFAARKADQRMQHLGKETVFKINGQLRTTHDIARYLKRRRGAAAKSPSPALTPEAITYFTPQHSPSLAVNAIVKPLPASSSPSPAISRRNNLASIPHSLDSTIEQRHHAEGDGEDTVQYLEIVRSFLAEAAQRRSLLSPLALPDHLHDIQSGFYAVQDFYRMTASTDIDLGSTCHANARRLMAATCGKIFSSGVHMNARNTFTAQKFWNDALQDLSKTLHSLYSGFLSQFMTLLMTFLLDEDFQSFNSLDSIHQVFTESLPKEHPLIEILKPLQSARVQAFELIERYMLIALDFVTELQPKNVAESVDLLDVVRDANERSRNWTDILKINSMIRRVLSLGHYNVDYVNAVQIRCCCTDAVAYMRLDKLSEAGQMIDLCSPFLAQSFNIQTFYLTKYLDTRAEVRIRMGDQENAVHDRYASWQLANQTFGPSYGHTVQLYWNLNAALRGQQLDLVG